MRLIKGNDMIYYNLIKIEKWLVYSSDICYYSHSDCAINIVCEYYPPFSNNYYPYTTNYWCWYTDDSIPDMKYI